jgi:hypothetical protein
VAQVVERHDDHPHALPGKKCGQRLLAVPQARDEPSAVGAWVRRGIFFVGRHDQ